MEALICYFYGPGVEVWFLCLTNPTYEVLFSLAAPVPKSQKGQGPRPVSRAGLLGARCSMLLPPARGAVSCPWLMRTFSCSDGGRHPFLGPLFPLPSALHSSLGSGGVVRGQAPCRAAPRQSGSWQGFALWSLGTFTDPACHFQQARRPGPA